MSTEPTGQQLIERAVAGDPLALDQLLLGHFDRLSSAVERKLPSDMRADLAAEDVVQEAYIVAVKSIAEFQPRGPDSFYHWLLKIAEHRMFDMIKHKRALKRGGDHRNVGQQDKTTSMVELLALVAVNERTPSHSAARHEAVLKISRALEELKEEYREALRLRYIDGLPVAEVAERLGKTEGAIHMLCHRGLRVLEESLGSVSNYLTRK